MKKYLLPLMLAALLSACGGGGGSDPAAAANAQANVDSDNFTNSVAALVGATPSETDPAIDIDSVVLGTSEEREPAPII